MSIELQLRTGNPAAEHSFLEWKFVKNDDGSVELHFVGKNATLLLSDWTAFVNVVKERSPALWRSNKVIPDLAANNAARDILRGCGDTVSYQLLLAGVDIVHAFKIMENPSVGDLLPDFENRDHTIRSITGPGGIYFVPNTLTVNTRVESLLELLSKNKLGEAELKVNQRVAHRYYIPYAVPSTLEKAMSREANMLWENIRNEYYAFRYPLPTMQE